MRMFSSDEDEYSYDEAIELAQEYGLEEEIKREMDKNDCTPNQALKELNIYPYEDNFNSGTIKHFQD